MFGKARYEQERKGRSSEAKCDARRSQAARTASPAERGSVFNALRVSESELLDVQRVKLVNITQRSWPRCIEGERARTHHGCMDDDARIDRSSALSEDPNLRSHSLVPPRRASGRRRKDRGKRWPSGRSREEGGGSAGFFDIRATRLGTRAHISQEARASLLSL